jgi:hypothetical protein
VVSGGPGNRDFADFCTASQDDTAVSNIMKTKHDTVKNSISNIR